MAGGKFTTSPVRVTIYTLSDPVSGDVRYVGKTIKTLKARLQIHVAHAKRGNKTHRCNWIRSLIAQGLAPIIDEIEVVDDTARWADRETHWISKFSSEGARLTNATAGGEGSHGYIQTAEQRAKRSASLKGRAISEEWRAKLSAAAKGRKISESSRAILAQYVGRPWSEDQRAKYVATRSGRKEPGVTGENNPRAKLTAEQASRIRGSSMTLSQIMAEFAISKSQASRVRRGLQWT